MTRRGDWHPIPGFAGYEITSDGYLRSFKTGRLRLLRSCVGTGGYVWITLRPNGKGISRSVHSLVALAFLGPRLDGQVVRHLNAVRTDNCVENLAYGTYSDNARDIVRLGLHPQAAKTRCINDHEYTKENTYRHGGQRHCRACKREAELRRPQRRRVRNSKHASAGT